MFPYLILISIYFFFINLEARKTRFNYLDDKNKINDTNEKKINNSSYEKKKPVQISIPVIPFKEN